MSRAADLHKLIASHPSFALNTVFFRYGRFFANIHFNTPHASYDPPGDYDVFAEDPTVRVIRSELLWLWLPAGGVLAIGALTRQVLRRVRPVGSTEPR